MEVVVLFSFSFFFLSLSLSLSLLSVPFNSKERMWVSDLIGVFSESIRVFIWSQSS